MMRVPLPHAGKHPIPDWLRASPTDAELEREADRSFMLAVLTAAVALLVALFAFVALVGALALASTQAKASAEFACRSVPFVGAEAKAAFARHAPNHAARQLLIEHALRWDAIEMRRLCEAKVAGEPVTLGCLDGRRDWDTIVASVPDGHLTLPRTELNKVLSRLRAERAASPPHQSALNHCVRIGAINGIVQPVPDDGNGAHGSGD